MAVPSTGATNTSPAIIVIASVVYLPIVRMKKAEDLRGVGVPAIQSLWISTSMGLGYVVTALAPYFNINFSTAVALFVIGWVMLIYGCYALLKIRRNLRYLYRSSYVSPILPPYHFLPIDQCVIVH